MINSIKKQSYSFLIYCWYVFFVLSRFNVWEHSMEYYKLVNYYLKILTALLLIYYFNPLSNVSVKPFYRSMVFSAGTFLLLSTSFSEFTHTIEDTKNVVVRTTPLNNFFEKKYSNKTGRKNTLTKKNSIF